MRSAASDWCESFGALVSIIVALFLTVFCRCFIVKVMMGGDVTGGIGIRCGWKIDVTGGIGMRCG